MGFRELMRVSCQHQQFAVQESWQPLAPIVDPYLSAASVSALFDSQVFAPAQEGYTATTAGMMDSKI